MKETVVVIVGPTAVGKTSLSIELAKRFNGEIISGDAMQVYKGMDIGTAKIHKGEMESIPHYMIDIKNPDEVFTVADFQTYVQQYIKEISKKQKLPILVGGSGLYIQAALYNYNFAQSKRDQKITERLEQEIQHYGIEPLYQRLIKIDPDQADKIHPNNHRRVVRALEIYETTGLTMSEYQKNQTKESPYDLIFVGLEMDRKLLYERINSRVDKMIKDGLLDEVKTLIEQNFVDQTALQAIGYKEFIPYFQGEYSLDRAIELLKRNSRRYAKRQYTWFKNKLNVTWYSITPHTVNDDFENIFNNLAGLLKDR